MVGHVFFHPQIQVVSVLIILTCRNVFVFLFRFLQYCPVAFFIPPDLFGYFARRKKGHEGVKGTPVEDYQGTLVHDHEKTFYNYGAQHQECLAHVLRYLKDSIDNEADRTWNKEMRALVQEMIHYRNGLPEEAPPDTEKVREYEERYRAILQKAKEEYEYIPASEYYKDGYNLYLRMEEYMSNQRFSHDREPEFPGNLRPGCLLLLRALFSCVQKRS